MIGPETSSIARWWLQPEKPQLDVPLDILDDNVASSTTMPIESTRPKSDNVFSETPASHHGESADEGDRHARGG